MPWPRRLPHYTDDVIIWAICTVLLFILAMWAKSRTHRAGFAIWWLWLTVGLAFSAVRIAVKFPPDLVVWVRCGAIVLEVFVPWTFLWMWLWRRRTQIFNPERRRVLMAVRTAALAAPIAVTAFAVHKRNDLRMREVSIPIRGLPKDLDGLRIVQVSDLHLSQLVSEDLIRRAIAMANETRAHIAFVTGDLISMRGDPIDLCLDHVSQLRAEAGVLGCMGNHETYTKLENYTTTEGARRGIQFLRHEARILQFGSSKLNIAGVDYQSRHYPYLDKAEELIIPGIPNLLLSHNPDVFPVAAKKGYDLTLAGHTHGGQVTVEILHQNVNLARFFTPYVDGLYQNGSASVFVTRGVGTIGIPARLGAPPEVALIHLCAG